MIADLTPPFSVLTAAHDPQLIVLSLVLAIAAVYGAAALVERSLAERGWPRLKMLTGAATAVGVASWAVYFIVAWSYWPDIGLRYYIPTVLLSLAGSIALCVVSLYALSKTGSGLLFRGSGSVTLAASMAGVEAMGMLAMRLHAEVTYNPRMAIKAGVISVVGSWLAIWLSTRLRPRQIPFLRWPATAATLLGLTIVAAHYTAAGAVVLWPKTVALRPEFTTDGSFLGGIAAAAIVTVFVAIAALIALADRRILRSNGRSISAQNYQFLFEKSPVGIYQADLEGRLLDINGPCARLWGYSSRLEACAANIRDHFADPDEFTTLLLTLELHKEATGQELRCVKRDGTTVWVLHNVSLVENENGSAIIQGTMIDITERKVLEDLATQRDAAEEANRLKGEFLARISHEIRTPMNGILGLTDLALQTNLDEEQRDYLRCVRGSANSLLSIINDVLDFSKIEANRIDLDPIEFNLQLELRDAMKALAIAAHEKGLEFICDIDPFFPETVVGDPTRLRQVFINLVANAVKFTDRGEVILRASSKVQNDQADLRFEITDTGIGIPKEKQCSIFDPFAQADVSTGRRFGGTGLGLTIASRLVERMGGRIWVESEPGEGATFYFTLTLPLPRSTPPELYLLNTALMLAGKTALVVDDNVEVRRVLGDMLRAWQIRPILAGSGLEATRALAGAATESRGFDFVLVDAHLADADGFELVREIKDRTAASIPVIAMLDSANRVQDLSRCSSFGLEAHLMKPVWRIDLEKAILTLSERERACVPTMALPGSEQENVRPLRILLAEDNLINQKLATRLLQKQGHEVAIANNGLEALNAMAEDSFDAVLMDVQMPEMSGIEATQLFRQQESERARKQVIIAMTAHALPGDREKCLEAGMDEYISKPFNINELYALLRKVSSQNKISA